MKILSLIAGAAILAASAISNAQQPAAGPPAAATPAPPPPPVVVVAPAPPMSVEAKIYFWGGIITTAITVFGAVAAYALKKAVELKPLLEALKPKMEALEGRQDRQAANTGAMQEQINRVAVLTPGGPAAIEALKPEIDRQIVETINEQKKSGGVLRAAILVAVPAFLFTSCAGLPPRTYSVYGRDAEGHELGAKVSLGDTRIASLKK